ncbi:MAG: hypothetical protein HY013_00045 [Candidatus Solibacter usitatus]|nr:hypothetical protein [Candidatus Solibacter usitatus]
MQRKRVICLAAMAVLFAMGALAADVGGKWVAQVPGRGGQTRETTFNFKADGDKLTGTMSSMAGDVEIKDGKISGDSLSFKVNLEFGGNAVTLLFEGKVSGGEIKFTRKREGAEQVQEFTAKRGAS